MPRGKLGSISPQSQKRFFQGNNILVPTIYTSTGMDTIVSPSLFFLSHHHPSISTIPLLSPFLSSYFLLFLSLSLFFFFLLSFSIFLPFLFSLICSLSPFSPNSLLFYKFILYFPVSLSLPLFSPLSLPTLSLSLALIFLNFSLSHDVYKIGF